MKIKPVEVSNAPKYPDKYDEEVQQVLKSAKPKRWRGTSLASVGLSAIFALSLSGCYMTMGASPHRETTQNIAPSSHDQYITMGETSPFPTLPNETMIPLFEYGEGTGAIGCVSIAAPVFMSEEDAFAIISATFAEASLTLQQADGITRDVNLPVTNIFEFNDESELYSTAPLGIVPDGLLLDVLPVVFVSTGDVERWHKDSGMMSSVSVYNVKKAAKTLTENNPNIAVFYDPIASLDYGRLTSLEMEEGESDEQYNARFTEIQQQELNAARIESERLLRLQVEDFIKWLGNGGNS